MRVCAGRGADHDDRDLGVLEAIGIEQAVVPPAELGVLVGDVLDDLEGPVHGPVLRDLVLEVPAVQTVERADGHGMLEIEQWVDRMVGPDEVLHLSSGSITRGPMAPLIT